MDQNTKELIIKGAKTGIQNRKLNLNLSGMKAGKHAGTLTQLHATDLEAKNTLCNPSVVVPVVTTVELEAPAAEVVLQPLSFSVYRIKL